MPFFSRITHVVVLFLDNITQDIVIVILVVVLDVCEAISIGCRMGRMVHGHPTQFRMKLVLKDGCLRTDSSFNSSSFRPFPACMVPLLHMNVSFSFRINVTVAEELYFIHLLTDRLYLQ